MWDIIVGITAFLDEDCVGYTNNMSLKSSGSSIDPGTNPVTKHSKGVVITEGSKT